MGHTHVEVPLRPKWNKPEDHVGHTSHASWKKRSPKQVVSVGAPPAIYPVVNKAKRTTRPAHSSTSVRRKSGHPNRGKTSFHPTGREPSPSPSSSLLSPSPLHNSRAHRASSCAPAKATQHDHTPDKGKGIKCVSVSCATQTTHHEAQQDTDGLRSWAEPDLNSMLEGSKRPSVKAECFTPQEFTHPHAKDVRSSGELCMPGPVTRVQPTGKVGSPPNTFDGTLRKTDPMGKTTHECTEMEPPSRVKHHRADLQSMLARLEECEVRVRTSCRATCASLLVQCAGRGASYTPTLDLACL